MSTPIYRDATASTEERVADLLSRMTLEEKVGQMMQLAANIEGTVDKLESWNVGSYLHCTRDLPEKLQRRAEQTRLGIPLIFGIDAIHGHCFENNATVFPTQLALSCSWDRQHAYDMGRVTATEVRACGMHWTFSPVLCVARDTRWGRVNETFGEDPWLIGELATDMIRGYQGEDFTQPDSILACAKHYVSYGESIGGRDAYEAPVSRRKLLELFLPPFEKAAKKGQVATLMAGYQAIDGVPCSADSWLMNTLPKEEWGMDGFIVTDWNNVGSLYEQQTIAADLKEAAYIALTAGNDMIMATPSFYEYAIELVNEGRVTESTIDNAVRRILRYKFKLGLFDQQRHVDTQKKQLTLGKNEHWEKALNASRDCITLLSNKKQTLPLNSQNIKRVLLTGPNCDDVFAQLGDWSFGSKQANAHGDTHHRSDTTTVLDALKMRAETDGFELDYIKGADTLDPHFEEFEQVEKATNNADVIIACVGDTLDLCGEFHDRSDLNLTGQQSQLLSVLKDSGKPLIVVFMASKPLCISWISDHADALICAFNPGSKGGQAIDEVIFGEVNPSGKLTISFPYNVGQIPVYYNKYRGWHAHLSPQNEGVERYIDAPEKPLFPFGFGLSYTEFSYSHLTIENSSLAPNDDLRVSIEVTNTGQRAGAEITQLYIHDHYSSVTTPFKNLRGFQKCYLDAGETKTLEFTVPYEELSIVDSQLQRRVEPGEFTVLVGGSSDDYDLLKADFCVKI